MKVFKPFYIQGFPFVAIGERFIYTPTVPPFGEDVHGGIDPVFFHRVIKIDAVAWRNGRIVAAQQEKGRRGIGRNVQFIGVVIYPGFVVLVFAQKIVA